MGIWEWIGSTAEVVKQNAPDATPVKNACTYGGAAITKIVRNITGPGQLMPDDETKSKIGTYATIFAKNAAHCALKEYYKFIPGADAFSKIVSKTLKDVEREQAKLPEKKIPDSEDIIGEFMKKDFVGNRLFDDLQVPRKHSN